MSDQQIDPVDNREEDRREEEDRRKAQRRQGDDVEYLKHEENRRRAERRKGNRRGDTIDKTLTERLDKGPDMNKIMKIVFTRVLFVIVMAIIFYHIITSFIFPKKLFKGNFDTIDTIEDIKK